MKDDRQTFQVEYHTQNKYESPVQSAHWQLLVLPINNEHQKLDGYTLNSNLELKEYITKNLFNGECLNIQAVGPFRDFRLSIIITVTVKKNFAFNFNLMQPNEEREKLFDHNFIIDNAHFLMIEDHLRIPSQFEAHFSKWGQENLTVHLQTLLNEINNFMEFARGETEVSTTATQALELKKGVCQDFAHILLGLLRKQKIASRYVCGYLCQGLNFKGAAQLHAWVECYVPGGGWIGLDPSNNLFTDHSYIKISHGRNYEDCTPIRGVLETGGTNSTSHQVRIFQVQNEQ